MLSFARFTLAMGVMLGHMWRLVPGGIPFFRLEMGQPRVYIFLVISGFSIAASVSKDPKDFGMRRIDRLAPLYYPAMLFALVPFLIHGPDITLSGGLQTKISDVWSFVGMLFFLQGIVVPAPEYVNPFWNLGCEVTYYAVARKIWSLPIRVAEAICVGGVGLFVVVYDVLRHASFNNDRYGVAPICLLWAWLLGLLLYKNRTSAVVRGILLVGSLATGPIFGGYALVLAFLHKIRVPSKWRGPMFYLGKLSYPLYLVHWTVINLLGGTSYGYAHPYLCVAASVVMSLAVSAFFYHGIEQPYRNYERKKAEGLEIDKAALTTA